MRLGSFGNLPPVTKHLLIINAIIWLAAAASPSIHNFIERYCALYYFTSDSFNIAQLFTYMFVQFDFMHLFFNMFAVFMFGMTVERVMGSAKFLLFYISCGLGAALIQEGVFGVMINHYENLLSPAWLSEIYSNGAGVMRQGLNYNDPTAGTLNALINTPMVGASGAVYGILLAFAMFFPNMPLYLMFIPIPIKAKWMVIGYAVIEFTQAISNNPADNVAHVAHLGGMLVGLLLILYWRKNGTIRKDGFY